jgi:RNA polymerase-binding transcription factor DksA
MNARRRRHFQTLLLRDRVRIVAILDRIAKAEAATTDGDGASSAPGDEPIAGATGVSPDVDSAVVTRETNALAEIDEALRILRMAPDRYGMCGRCGRPIAEERLEILPATRICERHVERD